MLDANPDNGDLYKSVPIIPFHSEWDFAVSRCSRVVYKSGVSREMPGDDAEAGRTNRTDDTARMIGSTGDADAMSSTPTTVLGVPPVPS